jgi:threonine dehydrogenase-like Zn-dependent dehydrogenase
MPFTAQLVLTGPGQLEHRRRELPPLRPGQVRLRVTQCGVCASEVDRWRDGDGPFPAEVGHEVAGVVEEVVPGGGPAPEPGDHVVAWVPGGGCSERLVAESAHTVGVPPDLPFPAVVEPLACCVNAVETVNPPLGADVVVVGTGFLSRLLVRLSLLRGARSVTVAGRRRATVPVGGATATVDLRSPGLAEAVASATGGRGADVVYEATGVQEGLTAATRLTPAGGTLAIVGYHQGGPRSVDIGDWNARGLQVVNAHFRDLTVILRGMREAASLLASGRLDAADLLTHRYPLDRAAHAFRAAENRPAGFVKAVIEPCPSIGGTRR